MRRATWVLLALALIVAPATATAARCAQTTIADMEDEVMCSVCGTTLGLAREAPQAKRERAFIGRLIASCRTKDEIKAALVSEFGPAVLAEPSDDGLGAWADLIPLVAGAVVFAMVVMSLLRWRRRTTTDGTPAPEQHTVACAVDDARVDAELERLR